MTNKNKILVVDDKPESLKLLTELLKKQGYEVRSAINGELALHAATSEPPELVLLDVRMPGMDGYEVCRRLKAHPATQDVPVIFVTAASEADEKVFGLQVGALDYVTKPFQRDELLARVRTHLELNHLRTNLESMVAQRTAELVHSQKALRDGLFDSVAALAATIEMRDPYTAGHQRRVAQLAVAIAHELQLSSEQIEGLTLAGVVHDVGKIKVPAEILGKPGKLTALEFGIIKEHSQNGFDIIKNIRFLWPVAQIVLQHHERLNGSGYPNGLRGADILIESRIVAVADVVESMMSPRPYRPGLGLDAGLAEIEGGKGTVFDPAVVDACIRLFRDKGFTFAV